jgi:hypothetical protein
MHTVQPAAKLDRNKRATVRGKMDVCEVSDTEACEAKLSRYTP